MHTLIIPDVHGLPAWRPICEAHPKAERVVFLGDYFDAFDVSIPDQLANFEEILTFRQNQSPGRVTLLLGNHDYHYLAM